MSRPRLTRRGEAVVLLGVVIALGLLLTTLRYRWVQAYAIAGAAVLGILVVALMVATVLVRAGELAARLIRRRPRRRPTVPVSRNHDEISPDALQRIHTAVADELAQRRRRRA